jgi:hypothetical protein
MLNFRQLVKKMSLPISLIMVLGINNVYAGPNVSNVTLTSILGTYPIENSLPKGNYIESCQRCVFDKNNKQLSCLCKDVNNYWVHSKSIINNTCKYITNDNGFLTCYAQGAKPTGSYGQTCSQCHWDSSSRLLQCDCNYTVQRQNRSELKVPKNCISVENLDGYLSCTKTLQSTTISSTEWTNPKPGYKYISPGPIWNNNDATRKCNYACPKGYSWNGQWRTVPMGKSICECAPKSVKMLMPTESNAYSRVKASTK